MDNNMFERRKKLKRSEDRMGISHLTERTRAVLEFIIFNEEVNITKITKEEYFREWSFSTIKRDVIDLSDHGLITSAVSEKDKRVRYLEAKFKI